MENIEQLFSMMQQSVTDVWKKHLSAGSNDEHVVLNDFYETALEQVDKLIEIYMGIHGKLELEYSESPLDISCYDSSLDYLTELRNRILDNKSLLGEDSEVLSELDTFLSTIDSTLYKLRDLCDVKSEEEKQETSVDYVGTEEQEVVAPEASEEPETVVPDAQDVPTVVEPEAQDATEPEPVDEYPEPIIDSKRPTYVLSFQDWCNENK